MTPAIIQPESLTDLAAMSTADLHHALGEAIGLTARAISHVAVIWTELTNRGEDLSGYKFALADYMLKVSSGKLLPEAVAQLAGRTRTLGLLAEMPINEQRRLIDGGLIPAVTDDGIVEKSLADLSWTEAARVIRAGRVVTAKQQQIALTRMQAARRRPGRGRRYSVGVDADAGLVRIGQAEIQAERIIAALRDAGLI